MAPAMNVKAIRERLSFENKYIIDMCKLIPVRRVPVYEESKYLLEDEKSAPGIVSGSEKRGTSLEELHKKLQELKGKKLRYRGTLFKKGVKNKIDKIKKREARKSKKNMLKSDKESTNLVIDVKPAEPTERIKNPVESTAPVYNKEGHLIFNKFDFAENLSGKSKKMRKRGPKDPHAILIKLSKLEEKLKSLEETGQTERVKAIKEKIAWETALKNAKGIKVKDNPTLLKKTLKRKEKSKIKSRKEWKKREEAVAKQMKQRQEVRQANINLRTDARKAKKIKKLVKKGHLIPGIHV